MTDAELALLVAEEALPCLCYHVQMHIKSCPAYYRHAVDREVEKALGQVRAEASDIVDEVASLAHGGLWTGKRRIAEMAIEIIARQASGKVDEDGLSDGALRKK